MKKQPLLKFIKLIIILAVALNTETVKAQDYYHGLGGQYSIGSYKLDYNSPTTIYSGETATGIPGIFYKATLGFSDNFAVSAYPFLGFNLSANSQTGGSGSLGIELPINAELYLGTMDEGAFFIGAGFTYAFLTSSFSGGGTIMGPQFALGGQFYLKERLYGLRAAYTIGINEAKVDEPGAVITLDKKSMFSIGVYYLFGQ